MKSRRCRHCPAGFYRRATISASNSRAAVARLTRRMRIPQTSRRNQGCEVLTMNPFVGRGTPERGAILIQVAISILALTAFAAFVVDYGVLWVARGQAQNAADAGALAGAIAMSYDDTTYPPTANVVKLSAAYAALCAGGSSSCP